MACFIGGLWLNRKGPRIVALSGGLLYGLGVFLASFSRLGLGWLYLTYGLMGGAGVGLAIHCADCGAGEVVSRPARADHGHCGGRLRGGRAGYRAGGHGPHRQGRRAHTFAYLGIAYLVVAMSAGFFMQNPPEGWHPEGWTPSPTQARQRAVTDFTFGEALASWQWWALWILLFLNSSAGIALISQEAPMFETLGLVGAGVAAGMVGVTSIGNSVGRIFWAWVSDSVTRRWTLAAMFILQCALFWILPSLATVTVITAVSFAILSCYGGGYGVMPAFAADYFGCRNIGPIYGLMATAWGAASAFGPLLLAYTLRSSGGYGRGLHIIAGIMAASTVLPILMRPPRHKSV